MNKALNDFTKIRFFRDSDPVGADFHAWAFGGLCGGGALSCIRSSLRPFGDRRTVSDLDVGRGVAMFMNQVSGQLLADTGKFYEYCVWVGGKRL